MWSRKTCSSVFHWLLLSVRLLFAPVSSQHQHPDQTNTRLLLQDITTHLIQEDPLWGCDLQEILMLTEWLKWLAQPSLVLSLALRAGGCWIVISVFSCQHRQPGSAVQQQNVVIQNIVHRQSALIPQTRQHHEIESSQPGPAPRHCRRQEGDPEETRRLLLEAPEPGRQSGAGWR